MKQTRKHFSALLAMAKHAKKSHKKKLAKKHDMYLYGKKKIL